MKILFQVRDLRVEELNNLDEIEALVSVFESIAREEGWRPEDQLRAHIDRSTYLSIRVSRLAENALAGGLQLIQSDIAEPLPCASIWPEVGLESCASLAHVTMLAIRKEYRGRYGLFWPLCVELWRACTQRGIRTVLLEATPPTLRLYQRLGWPLEIVGGLRPHWGEDCYLCRMDIGEVATALKAKAERSAAYRRIVEQAYRDRATGPTLPS